MSASATPTFIGSPDRSPVIAIHPHSAWATKSYPGRLLDSPKPVIVHQINPGRSAHHRSGEMPRRSRCGSIISAVIADGMTGKKHDPDAAFDFLMDLGGADYLKFPQPKPARFCVSYQFLSSSKVRRFWLKVYVPEGTEVPTLCGLYDGANWYERETFDLMGVVFRNHPDLRRIMLPEDWTGHPLRKDYPITGPRV